MLQKLFEIHNFTTNQKNRKFKRFLFDEINWQSGAICIYGARGTGKTTLMVQHYHQAYASVSDALYISADHISIISHGLYEIADQYFKYGGKALYIDEIHKYPNWSLELKNIIDVYSDKKIVFSGSSSLNLFKGKGDLSRRVVYYQLPGLSFREFLYFTKGEKFPVIPLKEILNNHTELAEGLKLPSPLLKIFNEYLRFGYYPFFLEGTNEYFSKLQNIIEKILFEDLTTVFNISQNKLPAIKKLIWLVASSQPFIPNIDRISKSLGISREYVYHYIDCLEKAGLLLLVRRTGSGFKAVRKPGKIYLENSSLIKTISEETGFDALLGNIRETFFANQLNSVATVTVPPKGDFMINENYLFEIGGKNKDFSQIKNIQNGFLALDGIIIGHGQKIPLYLFGFLY